VTYFDIFPNLLVSVHPDYVMTHTLTPLGPDRTHIECTWAFPSASTDREDFDPAYAVDFWDLTNRQDWSACEAVQRGVSGTPWPSGPIAPMESSMYRLETLIARGYLDQPLQPHPLPVEDLTSA
jgi:Rieske 2Fe-2S family protein